MHDDAADDSRPLERRGLEKWVREESFWKDITTRTIAGLITVFTVWVVGVLTGVFNSEGALEGLMRLVELAVIASGLTIVILGSRLATKGRPIHSRGKQSDRSPASLWVPIAFVGLTTLVVIVDFASRFLGHPIL
ncbi:hypothetical protein DBR36_01295 [Microbacterium sp. HMWF026]|uniref:hypothetical protein n=1 Tax=Microbacterium sp. HMWF026 TaxID=2056861 RepID=UPI000D3C7F56|nr:hypothetical protein [Microbacterium sp. HMWF026]PTT22794.1 hypothetical protein DBR36_01295 [Microbacterium sp. HMWF026]